MQRLWKYTVSKFKTVGKNYNVVERAENVLENKKRVPPRHPGTEVKFQVLIKDNPRIKEEVEKRDGELLNRLKIVKVTSKDMNEDPSESKRPLPQERRNIDISSYGFTESKVIPKGKCTLGQVLEFLTKHHNDPNTHSVEAIAKTYSLKSSDVENIITYFRAFELLIPRDGTQGVAKSVLDSIGAGKVVKQMYNSKFAHLEKHSLAKAGIEEEKK